MTKSYNFSPSTNVPERFIFGIHTQQLSDFKVLGAINPLLTDHNLDFMDGGHCDFTEAKRDMPNPPFGYFVYDGQELGSLQTLVREWPIVVSPGQMKHEANLAEAHPGGLPKITVPPVSTNITGALRRHILNEYPTMNKNPAFVKTYLDVIGMRATTGVLRVNEHHFANRLSTNFTDFSLLQKKFTYDVFLNFVTFLRQLGYLVETRTSKGSSPDYALNAFYVTKHPDSTLAQDSNNDILAAAIHVAVGSDKLRYASYVADGYDVGETQIIDFVKGFEVSPPVVLTYVIGFDASGAPITEEREIDLDYNVPRDIFYPYFTEGLSDISERFKEAESNLLLLVGPPGTGKSSLLRQLCRDYRDRKIYQFCGDKVILNPAFDVYLARLPDNSLVLIEDADAIIGRRKEGNTTMSLLLNELNGVVKKRTKFVISTNLENLKMVDEGLLRPGRCFDRKQFRALTRNEAGVIIRELNLPEDRLADNITLAELLDGRKQTDENSTVGFKPIGSH